MKYIFSLKDYYLLLVSNELQGTFSNRLVVKHLGVAQRTGLRHTAPITFLMEVVRPV